MMYNTVYGYLYSDPPELISSLLSGRAERKEGQSKEWSKEQY